MASLNPPGTPDHYVVSRNAAQHHNLGLCCAPARKGLQRFIMRSLYVGQELDNVRRSLVETGLTVVAAAAIYVRLRLPLLTHLPVI